VAPVASYAARAARSWPPDPTTKTYVTRRLAQGKSIREIKRCLKRYVARSLFRQLEALPAST